jgi:hypothetical protein
MSFIDTTGVKHKNSGRIFSRRNLYSLPKVFSYPPLTLALSHKGKGNNEEKTFGNRYNYGDYGVT